MNKSNAQIKKDIVEIFNSIGLFTITQKKTIFVASPSHDVTMGTLAVHLESYQDVIALHPIEPNNGFKYVQINIL